MIRNSSQASTFITSLACGVLVSAVVSSGTLLQVIPGVVVRYIDQATTSTVNAARTAQDTIGKYRQQKFARADFII